jgi:uncharacterized low-complexity protein
MNKGKKLSNKLVGSAIATVSIVLPVTGQCSDELFTAEDLPSGYLLAEAETGKMPEGKCGEGKCGSMGKAESSNPSKLAVAAEVSAKTAEGKCGAGMKMGEGSCGASMGMGGMDMDEKGMVMNANTDKLPRDCKKISEDVSFTVTAGTKYATHNGTIFGFDRNEWNVKPCSRVTVRFINEDSVRHQWMMHGLPKYIYPEGMFHLEVNGPGERTGTFIVASDAKTMLVHCDISQHMQKGMKGQFKVNGGSGDLPSIPGISGSIYPDSYKRMKRAK